MKKSILLILLSFSSLLLSAQNALYWEVQNNNFIDNREYYNDYNTGQTMLGSHLSLTTGFSIDSVHFINFGLDFLYEYGTSSQYIKTSPIIYYNYKKRNIDFLMGAFPRLNRLAYPDILITDTIAYYRATIEGAMLNVKYKYGEQNIWIDWTSRQSETTNESFMAGSSGKFKYNYLVFENYMYMYHQSTTSVKDTSFHIKENRGALFLFGLDFTDKLYSRFYIGPALSYNKTVPEEYVLSKGFYAKYEFEYKFYQLRLTHYSGDKMNLINGDHFYNAPNYTRFDNEISFFNSKSIRLQLQFSVHFFDNEYDFSQRLLLYYKINGNRKIK